MVRSIGNRVLVEVIEDEEPKTKGGIVLTSKKTLDHKFKMGKVLGLGEPRILENGERITISVTVGETVFFHLHAGVEIEVGGKKLLSVPVGELLAAEPLSPE